MKLQSGERLLLKRALQTHAKMLLEAKARTLAADAGRGSLEARSIARELDDSITACDALAERLLKENDNEPV